MQTTLTQLKAEHSKKQNDERLLQEKIEVLQSQIKELGQREGTNEEVEFLRSKLMEAENYIFELERIKQALETSKGAVSGETQLTEENRRLKVELSQFNGFIAEKER